jgi:hypothetical protein
MTGEYYSLSDQVLVVNDGTTEIPNGAFSGMEIEKVILPAGIVKIGDEAFKNCRSLKEINLPEGILYIGTQAFRNTGLEEVIIPLSVQRMGDGVFMHCMHLKKVLCRAASCPNGWYQKAAAWDHDKHQGRVSEHMVFDWLEGNSGFVGGNWAADSDCKMSGSESNVQVIWDYKE